MKQIAIIAFLCLSVLFTGCSLRSGSVPTNLGTFHNPEILRESKSRIDVAEGGYSEIFGISLWNSSLAYTYGLSEKSEINLNIGYLNWTMSGDSGLDSVSGSIIADKQVSDANLISTNLSYRANPYGENFAYWFGGGLGMSKFANVYSLQTGLMISYINQHFTPSAGLEVWYSSPFSTKPYCFEGECTKASTTYGSNLVLALSKTINERFLFSLNSKTYFAKSKSDIFLVPGGGILLGMFF